MGHRALGNRQGVSGRRITEPRLVPDDPVGTASADMAKPAVPDRESPPGRLGWLEWERHRQTWPSPRFRIGSPHREDWVGSSGNGIGTPRTPASPSTTPRRGIGDRGRGVCGGVRREHRRLLQRPRAAVSGIVAEACVAVYAENTGVHPGSQRLASQPLGAIVFAGLLAWLYQRTRGHSVLPPSRWEPSSLPASSLGSTSAPGVTASLVYVRRARKRMRRLGQQRRLGVRARPDWCMCDGRGSGCAGLANSGGLVCEPGRIGVCATARTDQSGRSSPSRTCRRTEIGAGGK